MLNVLHRNSTFGSMANANSNMFGFKYSILQILYMRSIYIIILNTQHRSLELFNALGTTFECFAQLIEHSC